MGNFLLLKKDNLKNIKKILNECIVSFGYASKTLLIFSITSSGVSHCLFTTVICTLIGIASVRIGLTFFVRMALQKCF